MESSTLDKVSVFCQALQDVMSQPVDRVFCDRMLDRIPPASCILPTISPEDFLAYVLHVSFFER
jgi:hypothetical protein